MVLVGSKSDIIHPGSDTMRFQESKIAGAWVIDITPIPDQRGLFATTFLPREFERRGMQTSIAQGNLAFNHQRGTLRGMHFQKAPRVVRMTLACARTHRPTGSGMRSN